MRGGNGGGTDKSSDTELQSMITEVAPKFQLLTYEDAETGTSLQYQLFIPENYDETQSYPMIQFIPDSSAVGRGTDYVLTQGWGGLIWATEEEQAKHPAFVVVPVFTETVVDDNFNHSSQIDVAMRLLQSLTETYSIDTDRIYTTGQSMGGMTSFHLSIAYPGFFAAYLFIPRPPPVRPNCLPCSMRTAPPTVIRNGARRMTLTLRTQLWPLCWRRAISKIS